MDDNSRGTRRKRGPTPTGDRRWILTVRDLLGYVIILQVTWLLVFGAESGGVELPLLRPILTVALLSVGPGLLILALLDVRDQSPLPLLLYAVGLSLMTTIVIGVSISLMYPVVGIYRPISEGPLVGTFTLTTLSLVSAVVLTRDGGTRVTEVSFSVPVNSVLVLLTVPFLGIIAISSLNRLGTNIGAIGFLLLLSLVPLIATTRYVDVRTYPLVVWVSALGLLYFKSLWDKSYPIEMWMHQMVIEQGRWTPVIGGNVALLPDIRGMGQEGVLTDAVLYPIYALMADNQLMTQLEVINPLFVSVIPLAMYATFRRYVSDTDALLSTFVFIFTYRFYSQHYPNAPRDVMATLFLVLIALLIADSRLDRRRARPLALVFAVGISVSHYGAAYLSLGAFGFALFGVVGLRLLKDVRQNSPPDINIRRAWGVTRIINPVFLTFMTVFVLTWYFHTGGGLKFMIVTEIISNIDLITEASGLATTRVLSPKPFSVEVTRGMIVVGFMLLGLGVVTESLRRILGDRPVVDDELLSVTVGTVGVFALTFTGIGTGFGQGRILMFCLSLGSLFIGLAAHNLREVGDLIIRRYTSITWVRERVTKKLAPTRVQTALAVCLCVFLLFNTGVVAETITGEGDYGPNIIVNNERLSHSPNPAIRAQSKGCIRCDIQTHLWILRHGVEGSTVYDGGFSKSYYWYGHSVAQLDDFVEEYLLTNRSTLYQKELPSKWSNVERSSYIVVTHRNYVTNWVFMSHDDPVPIREVQDSLDDADRIYTSGHSVVYRHNTMNSTAEPSE